MSNKPLLAITGRSFRAGILLLCDGKERKGICSRGNGDEKKIAID
jgi:hypothetical protein